MEDTGKCCQDSLIFADGRGDGHVAIPAVFGLCNQSKKIKSGGIPMLRISVGFAAILLVAGALHTASAQTAAPAATPAPAAAKPSKMKLTAERLKDMKAKWSANKSKLAVCRKEVKSKGLAGDDRWFYIEDCMGKT
jgi:hypothetical protein